jgi:hypothetical protein
VREPLEVEFEHRRLPPGAAAFAPAQARVTTLKARIGRGAQLSRALVVVGGAAGIAWATQRAGLALPGALCLFFGALPVLWVGGWLLGFLFQARRTAKQLSSEYGSMDWQQAAATATVPERVKLGVSDEGLEVTREGSRELIAWGRVSMNRAWPTGLVLFYGATEGSAPLPDGLVVPCSAFPTGEGFDDFCAAVQRQLWAAERSGDRLRRLP